MWHLPRLPHPSPHPPTVDRCSSFQVFFFFFFFFFFTAELHIHSHPSATSRKPFLVHLRVSAFIAVFRHVPYRWLIERVRVNFSNFSAGISSRRLSLSSSLSNDENERRKETEGWRERKVATRHSRMHNSRLCPWTDGSSEFNDPNTQAFAYAITNGEHNRGWLGNRVSYPRGFSPGKQFSSFSVDRIVPRARVTSGLLRETFRPALARENEKFIRRYEGNTTAKLFDSYLR